MCIIDCILSASQSIYKSVVAPVSWRLIMKFLGTL